LPPLDKRLSHRRAIHNSLRAPANGLKIERIFFTDSSAADALGHLNPTIPATLLPDPWEKVPSMNRSAARQYFSLPQQRSIFLHIGSSEKRKGLSDTLAAFNTLSQDPALKDRLLLLRVGENERIKSMDRALLDDLAANGMAKIIDQFVPESDFIEYFAASDWILLPYRNFRYSSGILSNAVAAQRPIIAANHGLIARKIRESNLGLLFRHRSRVDLACKIREAAGSTASPQSSSLQQKLAPRHFLSVMQQSLNQAVS
jgi:glycosyltransferase involved in cell wall biosynthesis